MGQTKFLEYRSFREILLPHDAVNEDSVAIGKVILLAGEEWCVIGIDRPDAPIELAVRTDPRRVGLGLVT